MAVTIFTAENRARVLDAFEAGCSLNDAAITTGIAVKTIGHWLTKGRAADDPNDAYATFARRADELRARARERVEDDDRPVDHDELLLLASRAARRGSVAAIRACATMLREQPSATPPDVQPDPAEAVFLELDKLGAYRRDHPEAGTRALPPA